MSTLSMITSLRCCAISSISSELFENLIFLNDRGNQARVSSVLPIAVPIHECHGHMGIAAWRQQKRIGYVVSTFQCEWHCILRMKTWRCLGSSSQPFTSSECFVVLPTKWVNPSAEAGDAVMLTKPCTKNTCTYKTGVQTRARHCLLMRQAAGADVTNVNVVP